tara:strand:+ start:255 stop:428 length:174 start_codon:yes stop_codon:yes gene_type:complete
MIIKTTVFYETESELKDFSEIAGAVSARLEAPIPLAGDFLLPVEILTEIQQQAAEVA